MSALHYGSCVFHIHLTKSRSISFHSDYLSRKLSLKNLLGVLWMIRPDRTSRDRLLVQTLMMLYLLNTPPALPPSLCSLMVLCI